uniref:Uncharacterized protein n=1 Tax=Romanomermis culicivorax TaxID=13658 RepID=A0A915KRN9_ROMCU
MGDVGAVGGSNMALGRSEVAHDVAGSTSIRCGGGSRTLNNAFGKFFKASKHFWIWASCFNGLI